MGSYNGGLEGGEKVSDGARREGLHEVPWARPDAEAKEEVKFIRGKGGGALLADE